ncbi:hypothetical protein MNBD_NITROSPINAE03-799, partial [hydrothermal vent metagenome]
MTAMETVTAIEQLKDITIDRTVWDKAVKARSDAGRERLVKFYLPSFKKYSTSEIDNKCANSSFPAISLTGKKCKLMCDHCQGKLLLSMKPATTPGALIETAKAAFNGGAEGILISGGSDEENRICFEPFLSAIARIKSTTRLTVAVHTGLIDRKTSNGLADAGVDTAMIDIIGADETIRSVYHLDKTVDDFEESLMSLCETSMKVAPHIVAGLHYGKFLGERTAMKMVARHNTASLVLVVCVPYHAKDRTMFSTPGSREVGSFMAECRQAMPDRELILGCARPGGAGGSEIDAYALAAGFDCIAFPADGIVSA